jgi:hypothetical protein
MDDAAEHNCKHRGQAVYVRQGLPHTLFFHLHSYLFIGIVDGGFCSRVSSSPSLDDDFAPLVLSDWQNVVSGS